MFLGPGRPFGGGLAVSGSPQFRASASIPKSTLPTASAGTMTRHPARVAAKLLKVTGAGTIRKQGG
jgi:hypothetical protein